MRRFLVHKLTIDENRLLLRHGELRLKGEGSVVVLSLRLLKCSLVVDNKGRTVPMRGASVHEGHLVESPLHALMEFRQMLRHLDHGLLLFLSRSLEVIRELLDCEPESNTEVAKARLVSFHADIDDVEAIFASRTWVHVFNRDVFLETPDRIEQITLIEE